MDGQPETLNPTPTLENSFESTEVDREELERKAISAKRMTLLLAVISAIIVLLIVWEIVDISLGGIQ